MKTTYLAAKVLHECSEAANEKLFERIIQRVQRYFRRLIASEADVQDCLQETLLLLEQSLRTQRYDPTHSFNAWIWLKAHSVYVGHCRQRSRTSDRLPELSTRDARREQVDDRMDAGWILAELRAQLGEEVYEAFVLHHEAGLNKGELARVLDRDPKTINKRLQSAHDFVTRLAGP